MQIHLLVLVVLSVIESEANDHGSYDPRVTDNIALWYILSYICNHKILLIIPTHPMFAVDIERGRVARAGGCCLRQARPEVQGINPPLIQLYLLLSRPTPPLIVSDETPLPPKDVSTRPSRHLTKKKRIEPRMGVPLHNHRLVPSCLPLRILEYRGGYGRMAMTERRDDG